MDGGGGGKSLVGQANGSADFTRKTATDAGSAAIPTKPLKAEIMDAEAESKMLLDQVECADAATIETMKPLAASTTNDDEVVRMDMSAANDLAAGSQMEARPLMSAGDKVALEPTGTQQQQSTPVLAGQMENKQPQIVKASDLNTQGASGSSDSTMRNSTTAQHEFTRSQEGDSVKENQGNHNKLVRQASTPRDSGGSQEDMGKADRQQRQEQQRSSDSSPEQSSRNQRSSQPKQIVESTILPDRSSKLSWCCCCPCSR